MSAPSSLFGKITKFISLSAIAGVLGVAISAPSLVVGGFFFSTGISVFENLPDYIKPVNGSDASTIYAKQNGQDVKIATFYDENRISVPFDQISPNVVNAVVSTEDPRFFEHGGVDVISLIRATLTNVLQGGGGPGGSTITMQYVKNSLVEAAVLSGNKQAIADATAVTIDRKLREMRLAIALEKVQSKQDILAGYLNLSFFGNQINGIEAASNYYFGVHAKDLSIPQAAMLAAMLKSPNDYKPDDPANLQRAKDRRDYVIDNMKDAGYISADEANTAKNTPITVNIQHTPSGCEADQKTAFFCDFVVWTIRNSPEFGPTQADREKLLKRGGLEIHTTMDVDIQTAADRASKIWVPPTNEYGIGSASVSVQAGTGKILAMAEDRIYDQTNSGKLGHTSVNYAADKAYGGSSGFQSGSTYKIFTLAQWLTTGHHLNDHVDGRVRNWNASDFSSRCGSLVGTWKPKNITKEPEDLTVMKATSMSVNTAYAYMASKLDLCDIRDMAMKFGVHRADGTELLYYPSSVIGVNELSPLTMAAAEAGIANHGIYCTPIAIESVTVRATNSLLQVPKSQCSQAVSPEVAAGMTYAMQGVINGGTGSASATGDGTPLAGKTGTTDSGVHTWMTGFSSQVATATWVGNVVGAKSLSGILLNKKAANTVRHDIWRTIMQAVNKIYPGSKFPAPPASMIDASMITVPTTVGTAPDAAAQAIAAEGLSAKVVVTPIGSLQPKGTVAKTVPAAGSVVPVGRQVLIYVSSGGSIVVPDVSGMTVDQAKAALLAVGFSAVNIPQASQGQFYLKSPTIPKGYVVATIPAAGTASTSAAAILLELSSGP
jgi:membrane peptidoglycan carboxypeptidase